MQESQPVAGMKWSFCEFRAVLINQRIKLLWEAAWWFQKPIEHPTMNDQAGGEKESRERAEFSQW